jgi:hypothetical protein
VLRVRLRVRVLLAGVIEWRGHPHFSGRERARNGAPGSDQKIHDLRDLGGCFGCRRMRRAGISIFSVSREKRVGLSGAEDVPAAGGQCPPNTVCSHASPVQTRRRARRRMDITWLTERIALGGGIWNSGNMAEVAGAGITHIVDMQIEFDDSPLAVAYGIEVLWNFTDDDFEPKDAELFRRGVEFVERALENPDAKVFIHCAAGVHRAPMMALAVLGSMGWTMEDAMALIEARRPVADFAEVYVRSVERFLAGA